jgi:hypothetical protein
VGINKDRHVRILIECPEIDSPLEAGYIFADCSRPPNFFLQFGGGPYMLRERTVVSCRPISIENRCENSLRNHRLRSEAQVIHYRVRAVLHR